MKSKLSLPYRASLSALVSLVFAVGCGRSIVVDLKVVEPCDQKNQALGGVSSYVLSSAGGEDTQKPVAFATEAGPVPLALPLGDVTVTVEAFADDVSTSGAASATPQAVGKTLPLGLEETSANAEVTVVVGKLNTFGKATTASGKCATMTKDDAVVGRHGHTATYVPKLNKVLLVGGAVYVDGNNGPEERLLRTVELWDPATGEFDKLDDINARAYHAATAMPDGRVLISGGFGLIQGELTTLVTGLLFDPESLTFSSLNLRQARAHHTSTLMDGIGKILLVGGCTGNGAASGCTTASASTGNDGDSTALEASVEYFNVNDGSATEALPSGLRVGRAFHQASVIGNGAAQVLVVTGGANPTGTVCDLEFFRQEGSALVRVDSENAAPFQNGQCPARHAAVALDAQRILVVGGQTAAPAGRPSGDGTNNVFFVSAEGVGPVALTLNVGRYGHHAGKLSDGSGNVIVVGGVLAGDAQNPVAERIASEPGTGALVATGVAGLVGSRTGSALTTLANGQLLLSGGHLTGESPVTSPSLELFFSR